MRLVVCELPRLISLVVPPRHTDVVVPAETQVEHPDTERFSSRVSHGVWYSAHFAGDSLLVSPFWGFEASYVLGCLLFCR